MRVFVYGTLKRGQRLHHHMNGARYLGDHQTEAQFSMFEFDDYPAVMDAGRHRIQGEIYRIDRRLLAILDEVEWYPRLYQRILIDSRYGDCWMYVVKPELCQGRRQIGGIWPEI